MVGLLCTWYAPAVYLLCSCRALARGWMPKGAQLSQLHMALGGGGTQHPALMVSFLQTFMLPGDTCPLLQDPAGSSSQGCLHLCFQAGPNVATGGLDHSQALCGRPSVPTAYPTDSWLTCFKAGTLGDRWDTRTCPSGGQVFQVMGAAQPDSRLGSHLSQPWPVAPPLLGPSAPPLHRWLSPCPPSLYSVCCVCRPGTQWCAADICGWRRRWAAQEEPEFRALASECAARDTQPFWGRCWALTGGMCCVPLKRGLMGVSYNV